MKEVTITAAAEAAEAKLNAAEAKFKAALAEQ